MNPKKLADDIEKAILGANDIYLKRVAKIERQLYDKLVSLLAALDVNSDGFIIQNASNRRMIREAEGLVSEILAGSAYTGALGSYARAAREVDKLNTEYFSGISSQFSPNKNFFKAIQRTTVDELNALILNEGVDAAFKVPLSQILNQNINTGGRFSGFMDQVRNYLLGEGEGTLLRYVRIQTRDILFNYSRAYQQAITEDLGLEFYLYSGGLIDTSRDFCIERAGKYFHHNEIEEWAGLTWGGKRKGTSESSIFTFAGGYGCSHSIIPVVTEAVPDEVIDRNVKNGNYKEK